VSSELRGSGELDILRYGSALDPHTILTALHLDFSDATFRKQLNNLFDFFDCHL